MPSMLEVARQRMEGVEDHIVVLDGVSWADYQRLLDYRAVLRSGGGQQARP